jgi:uncharacterized membrane protein
MQKGIISRALIYFIGEPDTGVTSSPYHSVNVLIAIVSFFSFLGGLYFVSFSKEKIEDEMVQRTRLDSFQFAALIQLIFTIAGFLFIAFIGDPSEGGWMLFFTAIILLFWLSFISRFNYILHVKLRQ